MTRTAKMGWIGAGMFLAGAGLTMAGAALMAPVCVSFTKRSIERAAEEGANRVLSGFETASAALGSTAGRMQRQFSDAIRTARESGSRVADRAADALRPN
jgi:hypothetical protein